MLPKLRSLLICTIALLAAASLAAETLRNPVRIPLPVDPGMIAAGDLNGDGLVDLIWEDTSASPITLHVLLAQPGGGYLPGQTITYPIATSQFALCILSDVNHDGSQDLVCASADLNQNVFVHVFLGNGDGTLQSPIATEQPSSLYQDSDVPLISAAGDLNGDGFPDILIDHPYQGIDVLLSDGKGGFKAPISTTNGFTNYATPVVADVNGDGIPDILWPVGPEVALGKGDGSFQPTVDYFSFIYYAATCVFHDMDGDGHLDAVCGYDNTADSEGSSDLVIFHGNPDGTFNTSSPIATKSFVDDMDGFDGVGTFRTPVAVTDANHDGILDILFTSGDGIGALLGGSGLTYSTPLHYAQSVVSNFSSVVSIYQALVLDVNGDGLLESVTAGPNGIYIAYGKSDGSFQSALAPEVAEVAGLQTVADFNRDGIPDIVSTGDAAIKVSLGKGDGTFDLPYAISNANGSISFSGIGTPPVIHGDFNGDGKLDLLALGSPSYVETEDYIFWGNGDGSFKAPVAVPQGTGQTVPVIIDDTTVFDINHDGLSDVLGEFTDSGAHITFALSNGDGSFRSVSTSVPFDSATSGHPITITMPALADFDGDGKLDAVYGGNSNAYFLKGHGDGTFTSTSIPLAIPPLNSLPPQGAQSVAVGDFDGDGLQDFAVLEQYSSDTSADYPHPNATAAWVYFGNGDGTFSTPILAGTFDHNYGVVATADLNQDGLSDLVLRNSGYGGDEYAVGVVHAQPNRTFGPEVNYTGGSSFTSMEIADLNRDGFPDLIFGNADPGYGYGTASSVTILLNQADTAAATTTTLTSSLNPSTYGQSVTFKATVSSTTTPTGSITFTDGTTTLSTVPLDASGNASFTTSSLTANDPGTTPNHPIAATYNPTGSFAVSGASLAQVVNGLPTTNTLTISPSSGTTATTYTLTATLKSASSVSSAAPTGTVTFYISPTNGDPGIQIGTGTLINGVATLTSSSLPVSSGFVYELYPGDSIYANSTSNSVNVNITAAGPSTTTTTLAITAAGAPVTTVSPDTIVTLTATTLAGTSPVTPGQVNFCDATAPLCTDIHLLGTAQLTSAGTATLKFIPGPGAHSYKAVFLGTQANITSSSPAEPLTVGSTSSNATTTTLSATGTPGNYTLSAVVSGSLSAPPTGTVSFLDTTNANYVLGTATLTPNAGGLTLFNSSTNPANIGPLGIVTADFNGDGIPDIATSGSSQATIDAPGTVTILLGKGDGTFSQAPTITTPPYPYYLVVGDFNNDGIADLAFTSTQTPTVTIVLGKGDGTFSPGSTASLGLGSGALAVGDFNGDGYADLAILTETNYGSSQVLSILLGNGDGTFTQTPTQLPIALQTLDIKVGDFNLDGKLDLAITGGIDAPGDSGSVFLLLGNGDGTFTPAPTLTTGSDPNSLAIADLNGDAKPDIAVVDDLSGTLSIFLGKGDGTFFPPTQPSAGFAPGAVSVADLNHDGKVDLVITPNLAGDGNILLLLGNGDGTFSTVTGPLTGTNPWSNAVADFNGDGLDDVAVSESFTNQVNVYLTQLGGSTATATVANISPVGTGPHLVDASYPGDSTYTASISNTVSLTAQRVPTNLTLTATVAPSGSPITLNAALSPNFAQNHAATGLVNFTSNGDILGTASISNGVASIAIFSLPFGVDALQAQYSGDTNFAPSTGTGSITIGQSTPPDFTFIGPGTITFRTEAKGVATLSLASLGGFTAPIAITCNAPLPPNYLCTLSSSTVTLPANSTASLTLTLHPNLNTALLSPPTSIPSKAVIAIASLFPLTLLALYRRRRRNPIHSLLLLLCLAAAATALTACGSDIYYAATPPGLYPITVTATGTNQGSSTPSTHTLQLNANITP